MFVFLVAAVLLLDGCSACYSKPSNPEQVREATANATAEIKSDAKAVAQGVRDGLSRPATDKPLDLNSASKSELRSLPGMTDAAAQRIVDHRPYETTHDLIAKRVISREEYDKIADRITVSK